MRTSTMNTEALSYSWVKDAFLILGGSLFVAALAQITVYLPFTPIPVTGQTLGVLLVGVSLGARRGALALGLYLVEGLIGLPFFANGQFGMGTLLSARGGYLVGFIASAYVTGYLAEKKMDRHWQTALPSFLIGQSVIFLFGLPWLGYVIGFDRVLTAGLLPFIPGEIIKIALAAGLLPAAWNFLDSLEK
jgi:biotin transport system substrate-specific component